MYDYTHCTVTMKVPLPNYEVTVNKSLNTGVVSLSRNFLPVSERVAALQNVIPTLLLIC